MTKSESRSGTKLKGISKEKQGAAEKKEKWVGRNMPRREAYRFTQGKGEYSGDVRLADSLYLCACRSPYAHARIVKIDVSRALEIPGVRAVFTGADLKKSGLKFGRGSSSAYPLAFDKVRYDGEPVAVVIADSPYTAEDGANAVDVEYEPLEPNLDVYKSLEGKDASLIHEDTKGNAAWSRTFTYGNVEEAFAKAQKIIKRNRMHVHRFTSAPLEPTVVQAEYNWRSDEFYIVCSIKGVEGPRAVVASALGVPLTSVHIRAPDIGGSFGIKDQAEWLTLVAWTSREVKRAVKWTSTQTEMLAASHHAEEIWWDAELAVDLDGTIHGFRATCIHDQGAYLSLRGVANQLRNPPELYSFKNFQLDIKVVLTNKVPCGANRAYAKLHHIFMLERLIDAAARELGMDPVEIRMKNFIQPEEMPYMTPNGAVYDGGDYPAIMQHAAKLFDYGSFRKRQQEMLKKGRYIGCGIALGMESNPSSESKELVVNPKNEKTGSSDSASVKIDQYGKVLVTAGDVPQGQGHESANAQIVADALDMPYEDIEVTRGYDSWRDASTPFSITAGSRWTVMGTGSLLGAARLVREKVLKIASYMLNSTDLEINNGRITDTATGKTITVKDVARLAYLDLDKLPPGVEPGLEAKYVYTAKFDNAGAKTIPDERGIANLAVTYTYEVSMVEAEVEIDTLEVKVRKICTVHDCGTQINPGVVESLTHGAIAHQLGAALFERMDYDENGQLLTATFKDYLCPTASDLPSYQVGHFETPSLFAPLGARAVAEGAGTPTVAAIAAVEDALSPFGVTLNEAHVNPSDLLNILRDAGSRTA